MSDDLITRLTAAIEQDERRAELLVEYYVDEPSPSPHRDSIEPAVRRFANREAVLRGCAADRKLIELCKPAWIDVSQAHQLPGTELIEGAGPPWAMPVLLNMAERYEVQP